MSTKHANTFTLTCKDITNIQYRLNSAYISEGQEFDEQVDIMPDGLGNWTVTFTAGRQKTTPVATSFIAVAGGSEDMLAVRLAGDKMPKELNFYFGLNITVRLPNGRLLDDILIYLGQGSDEINNNWWLGSINLINLNGRAVLLGTQGSQIRWRATADMSTSGCVISALTAAA